jgi:hypothetical protein
MYSAKERDAEARKQASGADRGRNTVRATDGEQ